MSTIRFNNAIVKQMLNDAMGFCAEKAGLNSSDQARQALHSGDCCVCQYFQHALAQKVAEYLGSVDGSVQAVFTFEPEQAIGVGEFAHNHPKASPAFNLIAKVDRKSAALSSVVASVSSALAEQCKQLDCPKANAMCYAVDVKIVDEAEVQRRTGYGALISSLYVRPIEIWQRQ
jgi:hypothetical protein